MYCFSCTVCGDCCTGDQTIRLNPDDLELLCAWLRLPDHSALEKAGYLDPPEDGDPRPRIRFRKRPVRQCPFLENHLEETGALKGLCMLHPDFKPLVCHLAPLAREVQVEGSGYEETWSVVAPVEGCPGMGRGEPRKIGPPAFLLERLRREALWMNHKLS